MADADNVRHADRATSEEILETQCSSIPSPENISNVQSQTPRSGPIALSVQEPTTEHRTSVAKRPRRNLSCRNSSDTYRARGSYIRRSLAASISSRSTSRAQSPYRGATGPSHPYGLYMQDANISRPTSIVSTSELHEPHTHMVEPGEDPFNDSSHRIDESYYLAGVRLAPQPSQRRLGADGEETSGLPGPNGYAEQLPPYSRYANDIPPKRDPDASSVVANRPSSSRVLSRQISRRSVRTPRASFVAGENQLRPRSIANPFSDPAPAFEEIDEKAQEEPRHLLRRRVCWKLLPCWLLSVIIFIVCLAAILGGVIGGMLARSRARKTPASASVRPTTTATESATYAAQTPEDGVAASTPITLPTIPTGSFAVTLNDPSRTSNSCLTDPSQNNAWDCSTGAHLNIIVNSPSTKVNSAPVVALLYPPPPMPHIRYGSQPPQLRGYSDLLLMQDKTALSKGLAYAFQQPFNKTVIVREQHFPPMFAPPPMAKRDLIADEAAKRRLQHESDWESGDEARPGDRPWYCFWNNTILEGFIYVSQNTNFTTPAPGTAKSKRQAAAGLPEYPKEIKVEEQRKGLAAFPPYCQQFLVLDDFGLGPVAAPDGTMNIFNLTEQVSFNPWMSRSMSSDAGAQNRTKGPCCTCAWTNTVS